MNSVFSNQRFDRYYESNISSGEPAKILGGGMPDPVKARINKPDGSGENLGNPSLSNAVQHGSPAATGISYIKAATLAANAVRALRSRGVHDPSEDDLHAEMIKSANPQKTPKGYKRVFGHYKPIQESSPEKKIVIGEDRKIVVKKIDNNAQKSPAIKNSIENSEKLKKAARFVSDQERKRAGKKVGVDAALGAGIGALASHGMSGKARVGSTLAGAALGAGYSAVRTKQRLNKLENVEKGLDSRIDRLKKVKKVVHLDYED
jgi:hypothetical protein